jgi:hypothetical protein
MPEVAGPGEVTAAPTVLQGVTTVRRAVAVIVAVDSIF